MNDNENNPRGLDTRGNKVLDTRAKPERKVVKHWTRRGRVMAGLVTLVVFLSVVAAVVILVHTFPKTPNGQPPAATSSCATLTQNGPSTVLIGFAGTVLYTCGNPPSATTNALTAVTGNATPTFTLPAGAGTVALSYVTHSSSSTTCANGTFLTSGVQATFTAGKYDYCLAYSSYPTGGIATFTISWSE